LLKVLLQQQHHDQLQQGCQRPQTARSALVLALVLALALALAQALVQA
jgi:hypothetical protein